jgi:hypothetical protein
MAKHCYSHHQLRTLASHSSDRTLFNLALWPRTEGEVEAKPVIKA